MKLLPWIIFVYFILVTEAARVPENQISDLKSEISNSDGVLDDIKSNTQQSIRRKRHYSSYSRQFWDRGTDRSYYDSEQDHRITELEIRLQIQQELINDLLLRRYEPKVITVPVYLPSSGNKTSTDPFENKFLGEIEKERLWGITDVYTENRPVSLKPVRPSRPMSNQPPVQHGTIQAETSTKAPSSNRETCKIAILVCCDNEGDERKHCFTRFDCSAVSNSKNACNKIILDKIMNDFVALYAPDSE